MSTWAPYFHFDHLSGLVGIFIGLFFLLTMVYSSGYLRGRKGLAGYYLYIIATLIAALGAVFANNLILFLVFWGFLGLLLYLLIGYGRKERAPATAKKAFIIIGGSDALMLLGIALLWRMTGTFRMDGISVSFHSRTAIWAYLFLAAGAFAKSGVMPLHTWLPDTAEDAPTPVTAYIPASLDKLLGIYFLARISLDMFQMNQAMNTLLMAVGSFTIIAAVMMALVQHDLKRLLGYHAVSQVGYMVLGIGTGNPIGIAGALFHMLNNAIYKSGLFFSSGTVEKRALTTNLDRLGGLARIMPITFSAFLISSLAISGVPPFNGFVSKWMIYQGIIETGKNGGFLWIIWLAAAIFGSALTLASFMKLVNAVFLGQPADAAVTAKYEKGDSGSALWIPQVFLAFLCIIFGVFAYRIPLKLFIGPAVEGSVNFFGIWNAGLATLLIVAGIVLGGVIYLLGNVFRNQRVAAAFVGGELLSEHPDMRVSGTGFYDTIRNLGVLRGVYRLAGEKAFDIYDQGARLTLTFSRALRRLHGGVLPVYLGWCLIGMIILLFILLR